MILPVAKLGTLALKAFCKPIARGLKKEASRHPSFRGLIIDVAQANHRFTTKLQRRIYGRAIDAVIRPLDEEKAVQLAADLVGELFVFTVVGVALIFEVQRNGRSEARKEEMRRKELQEIKQRDDDLSREVELLKQRIEELEQVTKGQRATGLLNFHHNHVTEEARTESPYGVNFKHSKD